MTRLTVSEGWCSGNSSDDTSRGMQVVEAGVLTNLPYADNSFDLVFSSDVLEHIQEGEARSSTFLDPTSK